MTERIIFLDIDGPIIPAPLYFIDSTIGFDRHIINTVGLGLLIDLCEQTGAKIVFNTSHNIITSERGGVERTIKEDMIFHGLPEKHIHASWKTRFPNLFVQRFPAIKDWISHHETKENKIDWVCFDDENFTSLKNLILVDFETGITLKNIEDAFAFFGVERKKRLIL